MNLKKRVVFDDGSFGSEPAILRYRCRIVNDSGNEEKELLDWEFQSINSKQLKAFEKNENFSELKKLYEIGSKWIRQYFSYKMTEREMCESADEFYCWNDKTITNKIPIVVSKILDEEDLKIEKDFCNF